MNARHMAYNERVLADPKTSTQDYLAAWKMQREHNAMVARINAAPAPAMIIRQK